MRFEEFIAGAGVTGGMARREALQRLALLGLSTTAAGVLLAACSDNNQKDQTGKVREESSGTGDDGLVTFPGPGGELRGAFARAATPKGTVLVVHGDSGLTPHFVALAKRLAKSGFTALAPDLLSEERGAVSLDDDDTRNQLLADLRAGLDELERRAPEHKLGVLGFSFGGEMIWSLLDAPDSRLAAAVLFNAPFPEGADLTGAKAAVLAIYAENPPLNATRSSAETALLRAGLQHEVKFFLGTSEGFFDPSSPRYKQPSADEAYTAVLEWFGRYLA